MHKAHFMSQTNVTFPVRIVYLEKQGRLELASRKELLKSPADREWRFFEDKAASLHGPFDLWELREQFLSWPPDDWQGFVEMAGTFAFFRTSQSSFETWQKLLREALIRPARDWTALEAEYRVPHASRVPLSGPLPIRFDWMGEVPIALVMAIYSVDAIVATIKLDKLQGAEFRVCARFDCKSPPFKVEARQKIYCSSDCAHLVAVRNSRSRAAEAKSKAAKKATKRKQGGGKSK